MLEYHNPGAITGQMENSIGVELVGWGAIFSTEIYHSREFSASVLLRNFWGNGSELSLMSVKDGKQYDFNVTDRSGQPRSSSASAHCIMVFDSDDKSAMTIFKDKENYPTLFEGRNAELGEFIRDVLINNYLKEQTGESFSFSDENGDYFKVAVPETV